MNPPERSNARTRLDSPAPNNIKARQGDQNYKFKKHTVSLSSLVVEFLRTPGFLNTTMMTILLQPKIAVKISNESFNPNLIYRVGLPREGHERNL